MKSIVIIGGGSGGVSVANHLAYNLRGEMRSGNVFITVVEGSKSHYYQPGFLEIPFGMLEKDETYRPVEKMLARGIKLVNGIVKKIDLVGKKVYLDNRAIDYDFIVIATGASYNYDAVPGLRENTENMYSFQNAVDLEKKISGFNGGNIAVGVSSLPYKCTPAPLETVFLLDDYFRKRGVRDRVSITYFFPLPISFPGKDIAPAFDRMMKKRNIEERLGFNIKSVDGAKKELVSSGGDSIKYDLAIVVPPHRGAQVILDSGIGDQDGWIPVDKFTLQIDSHDNAYAIGDSTNLMVSKAGSVADAQAIVVSERIASSIHGDEPVQRYDGTGGALVLTGSKKAAMVNSSYDRPPVMLEENESFYWLKLIYNRVYWTVTEKAVLSEVIQ